MVNKLGIWIYFFSTVVLGFDKEVKDLGSLIVVQNSWKVLDFSIISLTDFMIFSIRVAVESKRRTTTTNCFLE